MSDAKPVSSAANPAVKRMKSLSQKKYRDEEGVFLVEGQRHIQDALAGGYVLDTLAFSPRASGDSKVLIRNNKAEFLEVTDDLLSRITGRDNTQAMVAVFKQKFTDLKAVKDGFWVVLEGIRDPGNLGTIIRTADAVKATGVILAGDTCDPWSFEAIRGSMGSFARVHLAKASVDEFLAWRKGWTGRVVGTHLKTDTDFRKGDYAQPLLLVMGSESNGLSDGMAKACSGLVKIPMAGGAESLNLAVSTGIMLYEISRNRL